MFLFTKTLWFQIKSLRRILFDDFNQIRILLPPQLAVRLRMTRVLMFLVAFCETAFIFVIAFFGASVGDPETQMKSASTQFIFRIFPIVGQWCETPRNFLFFSASVVVAFVIFKNIATAANEWFSTQLTERIAKHIGVEIMGRYMQLPYILHISGKTMELISAFGCRSQFTYLILHTLNAQSYLLTTLFMIGALFYTAPWLTCIVYSFMIGVGAVMYKSLKTSTEHAGFEAAKYSGLESSGVQIAVRGIREIIMYNQQDSFLKAISDASEKGMRHKSYLSISHIIPSWVLETCGFFIIVAAIGLMIVVWDASVPEITTVSILLMLTAWRAFPALNRVVNRMVAIRGIRPAAVICLNILEKLHRDFPEIHRKPNKDFKFTQKISVENVSFPYPTRTELVLENISLTIPKGSSVGFIGPSGGGKSTLVTILSGLFAPDEGCFSVDGKELSPEERCAFYSLVGYVPQSPCLMEGTIAENIAFSEWGKPVDEKRIANACEMASIDFIDQQHFYAHAMRLGDNGIGLSGGQAQRVAIARAFYSRPEILIFDEATSALDQINENHIRDTIAKIHGNMTCIVVAHRLTTVEKCDMIYWIDKGKIVMSGVPDIVLPKYRERHT